MESARKASDLFVKCLEAEGVLVFGVPGEENAALMMSLDASEKIRFVLCRHEQGAAFMAEVPGWLTGHPAVCLGTVGPGATNLVTGVADANMGRAPLLVITDQGDLDSRSVWGTSRCRSDRLGRERRPDPVHGSTRDQRD